MLITPLRARVFVCVTPVDMRRGFDTLAQLVRDFLEEDPLDGHLFVFRSRRGDRVKILYWDADGYALWYKRLEEGTFRFPEPSPDQPRRLEMTADELALVLKGIDPRKVPRQKRYQRPETGA